MESQRQLFFKKQIMKELSQQKTEVPTSAENENIKNYEDCVVTLLGSQSYYDISFYLRFHPRGNSISFISFFFFRQNTEGVWNKENSSDTFPQKENDDDELIHKNYKEKDPELISTLTEVIAESEMELLRKSLEADEDDIEAENNNNKNDGQIKSTKKEQEKQN
ncbi:unnamed protein product [Arctia plantaginis]|uniref:Uncharacterized protein n=1 Tax=Arctia plantaginis TaxID=874455 RepID=A0A8S1B7X4_ARCPL|nr:unnamed protein product [Arctia plantaginis]